jgi:hypothetical protein
MEKSTIPSGFTAAHGHSGLLGQSPASWPRQWPLDKPTAHGRVQSVASAHSVAWRRVIGSKVFTSTIPTAPASSHYTKT